MSFKASACEQQMFFPGLIINIAAPLAWLTSAGIEGWERQKMKAPSSLLQITNNII